MPTISQAQGIRTTLQLLASMTASDIVIYTRIDKSHPVPQIQDHIIFKQYHVQVEESVILDFVRQLNHHRMKCLTVHGKQVMSGRIPDQDNHFLMLPVHENDLIVDSIFLIRSANFESYFHGNIFDPLLQIIKGLTNKKTLNQATP